MNKVNMRSVNNKYDLIAIWHSGFKTDRVSDPNPGITGAFLEKNFPNRIIIRNTLSKGGFCRIDFYNNNVQVDTTVFKWVRFLPDLIRYFFEPLIISYYLLKYGYKKRILSVDPMSAIIPALLNKVRYVEKVFFLTPDFSKGKRFSNKILNKVYFQIDRICTKLCTVNICNSTVVIEYKKEIYPRIDSGKYFHMPNIPPQWMVEKYKNIEKIPNKIIYVGTLFNDINIEGFKSLFSVIDILKNEFKTLKMVIVGDGTKKEYLQSLAKGIDNIIFLGQLEHEVVLKEIAESEVGLAMYNGDNPYDEFRDSLKIREYQSMGVISLTTSIVKANSEEIIKYQSGIIVDSFTKRPLMLAIKNILSDNYLKKSTSDNAILNYSMYLGKYNELNNMFNE